MLGDQILGRVEPDGEHDDVRVGDRLLDRGGAGQLAQTVRQRCRVRSVMRGEDDAFPAVHEIPCDGRTKVANSDDRGLHLLPPCSLADQCTRWASTSISRSTLLPTKKPPVSTAMFQVMSQSSRSIVVLADAANIASPSISGPHPRNSPERVTGLLMSLIVRSPSSSNESPPVGRTPVLLNVSTGCFSISRKSPLLRCSSRFSVWVVMLPASISTSTRESSGDSPTSIVPVNSVNWPLTFDSMCRATNPTTVWTTSSSYVPAGGIDTPWYSRPVATGSFVTVILAPFATRPPPVARALRALAQPAAGPSPPPRTPRARVRLRWRTTVGSRWSGLPARRPTWRATRSSATPRARRGPPSPTLLRPAGSC